MRREKTRRMTVIALLGAISILLTITPLGFIPIGPTNATIMHIPVIIGAIMEGPVVGAIVGLIFGLSSLINAMIRPTITYYVMINPLVSVLPRILMGIGSAYVYKYMVKLGDKAGITLSKVLLAILLAVTIRQFMISKTIILGLAIVVIIGLIAMLFIKWKKIDYAVVSSTVIGTLINSGLVLSMIYILYADRYMESLGMSAELGRTFIFGILYTNGIPEAILAVIVVSAVIRGLKRRDRS